eukprot:TRINITY_DN10293_c0_g1_i1.p1 TRINITY_DN10293_c0_g1~~TRINITY_DN10293_c0_g1_i1.p1  ORF type:complete len:234 (+),score=30.09 TRINITY_DN10293_c0_g1_i1:76-777(+)
MRGVKGPRGFWKGLGDILREFGLAFDRVGSRLQRNYAFTEKITAHKTYAALQHVIPSISTKVRYIAPSASVIGRVQIGKGSCIWYGSVLRGDSNDITVGENTSIGNRTVIHVAAGSIETPAYPTIIGNDVLIGDGALIHACTIEDGCHIGSGALIMDGAIVRKGAIVSAGSLVPPGKEVEAGRFYEGSPAKNKRAVTEHEQTKVRSNLSAALTSGEIHEKEFDILRYKFAVTT